MSISTHNSFSTCMIDHSLAQELEAALNNNQSVLEKIANIFSRWNRTSKDMNSNTTGANACARFKKTIVFIPSKIVITGLLTGWKRTALVLGFLTGLILISAKEEDIEFIQGMPSEESRLCQSFHFNCVEGHIRKNEEVVSQFLRFIINLEIGNSEIRNIRLAEYMSQCFNYQTLEEIIKEVVDKTNFNSSIPIPYHGVTDYDMLNNFAFSAYITSLNASVGNIIQRFFTAAHEFCRQQYEHQSQHLQSF